MIVKSIKNNYGGGILRRVPPPFYFSAEKVFIGLPIITGGGIKKIASYVSMEE